MNRRVVNTTVQDLLERTGGRALTRQLYNKSPTSERHSMGVSGLAVRLAAKLPGIDEEVAVQLGLSGALHDVGKSHPSIVGLVNSPERLPSEEVDRIRVVHTRDGALRIAELMERQVDYSDLLGTAAYVALHHHDRPETLPGSPNSRPVKPQLAGLIHIIDQFEAMQSRDRPYNTDPVESPEAAVAIIAETVQVQPFFGIPPETVLCELASIYSN